MTLHPKPEDRTIVEAKHHQVAGSAQSEAKAASSDSSGVRLGSGFGSSSGLIGLP